MKRIKLILLGLVLIGSFMSCEKDPEEQVIDERDKLVGSWNVSDQTLSKANYISTISKDSQNSRKLWVKNFHGLLDSIFVYLDGNNIELPEQMIADQSTKGSASLQTSQQITWSYWVNDGAQQDTISAVYQKNG